MSYLTDAPIDAQALVRRVIRRSDGAYVLFEGVVRNHHDGKAVESIFYDAYRPMAEKEMEKIVREVEAQFPDTAVAVVHRLGQLVVGDSSIAIAAASPHRAEAFAACRTIIDRVKETVPIWKKERGPDGEEWLGWQGRSGRGGVDG
ncbi:MAG TPA: molybdenum cofactor biosynthesis protein MoaE [Thermoanaerobaculia bacterium]|nr:molybdenum cofactor biosynthesis protein MoaE [Thermoanaerobaculia bacterium]